MDDEIDSLFLQVRDDRMKSDEASVDVGNDGDAHVPVSLVQPSCREALSLPDRDRHSLVVNLGSSARTAPLRESIQRLDDKVDRLADGLTDIRERLAHLKREVGGHRREFWVPGEKTWPRAKSD